MTDFIVTPTTEEVAKNKEEIAKEKKAQYMREYMKEYHKKRMETGDMWYIATSAFWVATAGLVLQKTIFLYSMFMYFCP